NEISELVDCYKKIEDFLKFFLDKKNSDNSIKTKFDEIKNIRSKIQKIKHEKTPYQEKIYSAFNLLAGNYWILSHPQQKRWENAKAILKSTFSGPINFDYNYSKENLRIYLLFLCFLDRKKSAPLCDFIDLVDKNRVNFLNETFVRIN